MTNKKEASARIKINKMLEHAEWRFFDDKNGKANIQVEVGVKITEQHMDRWGDDFEHTKNGYIDYLLLDNKDFPLVVVEAKGESKDPLDGKEQARKYAQGKHVRFVILSNGNMHYFWDLDCGNPEVITEFPTQESLLHRTEFKPNNQNLADEEVREDYIALTQNPRYKENSEYQNESTQKQYIRNNRLRILRTYQLKAIHALQKSATQGNSRFLFEMATGTGKTLVAGAVIKLFLRTENAKRILFLVDRLELENQAEKNFKNYLSKDYRTVIYKQSREDWKTAEIVISTVQSLSSQNKYKKLFSPTDFDLVISDEAHRSIGGNSRAVFEYFVGYKLGLTATPKDYLKNLDEKNLSEKDQRKLERRQLLDTYRTFGCESGEPTYRYSLTDGVNDKYLINPHVLGVKTEITTQLLSDKGYSVVRDDIRDEKLVEQVFKHTDFEKKFFSENTNMTSCRAIIKNALNDPISGEIGKTIIFCVSRKHATKITKILNQIADQEWKGKYNSDFAVQITSDIQNAQQMTQNFANNNLNGYENFLEGYKTSKTRICVTVGMMTTGYDCEDILNIVLLRPIFSPTDFIQMKGRGTRKFSFEYEGKEIKKYSKEKFNLFDFFGNYKYFEEDFNYDESLQLPIVSRENGAIIEDNEQAPRDADIWESHNPDEVTTIEQAQIGSEGMKIDRKLFEKARETIQRDKDIETAVQNEQWDRAIHITRERYEYKPELYLTLDKIRKSENLDRRLDWRETLERIFGLVEDRFPSKEEKLDRIVDEFILDHKPGSHYVPYIKNYMKTYIEDSHFRSIIDSEEISQLSGHPGFSMEEYKALDEWRDIVPEYIKNYVIINQFM